MPPKSSSMSAPPRRSGRFPGRNVKASVISKCTSSVKAASPSPSSHKTSDEAPMLPPAAAVSSQSPEYASCNPTYINEESTTAQTRNLSFAEKSTRGSDNETLAIEAPDKVNVAVEKSLPESGVPGGGKICCDDAVGETAVGKPENGNFVVGDRASMQEVGGTKSVGESGKKKVVKKKVKVVKVVKRMVPKKVMKGSALVEQMRSVEDAGTLVSHEQSENSEHTTTMELENVDAIPVANDSINVEDTSLSSTVQLEIEDERLKEATVGLTETEKPSPSFKEEVVGENMVVSEGSALAPGVTPHFESENRGDGMIEEEIENQVENKNVESIERNGGDRIQDQNLVQEGEKAVKEVIEHNSVGLNGLVSLSGEMEALERRRKRRTEIFIGGLDKDVKEEDIRKVFEPVGDLIEVRLMMESKTGKNKGFAFLRFASAEEAREALTNYSKVEICGKECGTRPVEGNDTIFLGNIDKQWKTDDVVEFLKKAGIEKIDHIAVVGDPRNSEQNRGFAFVEFETSKDAQIAFGKLQNHYLVNKKKIKVAWAQPLIEPDEEEMRKVRSVYAEFLPSSWNEEIVRSFFQRFGEVESVALAKNIPSSKRKDFAFINYTSREDALACIGAFGQDQLDDNGTKVTVKVSLAKPLTKAKKVKHVTVSSGKELFKNKLKNVQSVTSVHETRSQRGPTNSSLSTIGMDNSTSTTEELIQLLRNQASGSSELNYSYPSLGSKRPFLAMENYYPSSDSRGHPRFRSETSHSSVYPITSSHAVGMLPLTHSQQLPPGYPLESAHRFQTYQGSQMTGRAPYFDRSGLYRRY